jgi:hypothetical protein
LKYSALFKKKRNKKLLCFLFSRYDIKRNGSFEFTLAFQNSGWLIDSTTVAAATAKIYSIQITNTMGGGASNCRKCPKGTNDDGLVEI